MDDSEAQAPAPRKDSIFSRIFHRGRPKTRDDLAEVIQDASDRHIIDAETIDMLTGVFDIARLRISDIMIPRSHMITIDSSCTLEQAVELIARHGHSRYPLCAGDDRDRIEGILMAKDLLPYACGLHHPPDSLRELSRPAVIVPETKRVDSMLREFQASRFHMAIAVDEFGGVCGLVTIEDILELIVGDIDDEYDDEEAPAESNIVQTGRDTYLVKGLTTIAEFNAFFQTVLPKVDVDTIAGMVIHASGHLPAKDECVRIGRFIFRVLAVTRRQVHALQLSIDPGPGDGE